MERVVIFGGTGFIGLSLAEHLSKRNLIPVLVARNKPGENLAFDFVSWDGTHPGDWSKVVEGALAVVNLAGRSVDCIKTPENCDVILRSRVDATKLVGWAHRQAAKPPRIWVQMSTAHIYGDSPTVLCTENSSTGYGLAPFVGKAWEEALMQSAPNDVRTVILRTSFVIGRNGGALSKLKRIAKLGLGGRVGSGKQGISWIHEYDMNELFYQSIINPSFDGMYIASAPNPVSNAEFMRELRKTLRIPLGLPAPIWATKLGAKLVLNTDPDLALYGRYVKSERLENQGLFQFRFPQLKEALHDLLK